MLGEDTMKKKAQKITTLLLACVLVFSSLTGCTSGGEASSAAVKPKLIYALISKDYKTYLDLAYPPYRADIEAEKEKLGYSDEEYMQYLQDKYFPSDETNMISESATSFSDSKDFDATQLAWINDQYIYYDDYMEITSAQNVTILVRDQKYSDTNAPAFYEMDIMIVASEGTYFFAYFTISDTPFEKDSSTESE
jgi:hypothetical protein